jgi:NADH-quinone oxidoreductase subunit L
MSELSIISLSIISLFLPLIGFVILIFFGKRFEKIYFAEIGIISVGLLISILLVFVKLNSYIDQDILFSFTWIDFGETPLFGPVSIDLGVKIDNVTVLMLFVVNLISCLVHIYSLEYMRGDSRYTQLLCIFRYFYIFNDRNSPYR